MLQDLMKWEKWNLPRNHAIEEDLELHIFWPGCSASKQSSKQSGPMGTKKRKRKRNKQSKMRTQHPTQSPSIIATKTG
jgi:hypothetical protein